MTLTSAEKNRRYRARKRGEHVEPVPNSNDVRHNLVAGDRFDRLVVLREIPGRPRRVECACDCGTVKPVNVSHLVSGGTKSCGCFRRELGGKPGIEARRSHGLTRHPLYATWKAMLERCENPLVRSYADYGARGIRACPEWHDVAVFIAWVEANLGPRPHGCTIDRYPDRGGNYEPGNVRWATISQQNRGRRTVILTYQKAEEMRSRYAAGACSYRRLAAEYGVGSATVADVIERKTWRTP